MTDKELSEFGEKLYEAILVTPLPGGTIFAIASAIRHGTPWKALPGSLKLAVFKIAANCIGGGGPSPDPGAAATDAAASPSVVTPRDPPAPGTIAPPALDDVEVDVQDDVPSEPEAA